MDHQHLTVCSRTRVCTLVQCTRQDSAAPKGGGNAKKLLLVTRHHVHGLWLDQFSRSVHISRTVPDWTIRTERYR